MVKKSVGFLIIVLLGLFAFMPKQSLYYQLEKELEKNSIVMSQERVDKGLFSLTLKDADLYVKGIKVATIEEIELFSLLFYSSVSLENITLDSSLKPLFVENLQRVDLSYILVDPFEAALALEGDFGEASGNIDLKNRKLRINFSRIDQIGRLKREFKKAEEGWQYETSF